MKYAWMLLLGIASLAGCGSKEKDVNKKFTKFNGNYNKTFNDMPDLHMEVASKHGVGPLETRDDTLKYEDDLVRINNKSNIYKIDRLKHSVPFLVPKAEELLIEICENFRDSLKRKSMVLYKPVITSITRTNDDVQNLSKKNRNASENSVHRYATTFDIAWTRFEKVDMDDERILDDGKLKAVLGQVLHDLREREKCYIKHERKQSCFHITVR